MNLSQVNVAFTSSLELFIMKRPIRLLIARATYPYEEIRFPRSRDAPSNDSINDRTLNKLVFKISSAPFIPRAKRAGERESKREGVRKRERENTRKEEIIKYYGQSSPFTFAGAEIREGGGELKRGKEEWMAEAKL